MYHSIIFDDEYDCYEKWHLIPNGRPVVPPPSIKEKTIDIPGGNGMIDLTDSLTGYPLYNNREGSFEFLVDHTHKDYESWHKLYDELLLYFHGSKHKFSLEDDPDYYYQGRITVNSWKTGDHFSTITLDYNVDPFKYYKDTASVQFAEGHTWTGVDTTVDHEIFTFIPECITGQPITPYILAKSKADPLGTIQLEFHNEELDMTITTAIVADAIQRLPMCILSNLSGYNTIYFKMKSDCIVTIDFRNAVL